MRIAAEVPSHQHVPRRAVLAALAVTSIAAAIELSGAREGGSRFLSADAFHLVAHLAVFAILLLPAGPTHGRTEDRATISVLIVIELAALAIGAEALGAVADPRTPAPRPAAMLLSLIGLAANLVVAWLFRDPAGRRWSFRAALAHELSDALLTIAGLAGALAIRLWDVRWIDPVLSIGISGWLTAWAGALLVRRAREGPEAWTRWP